MSVKPKAMDVALMSGAAFLISKALGASTDKSVEYGIEVLRFFGVKFEIEYEDAPTKEPDFMLGLT